VLGIEGVSLALTSAIALRHGSLQPLLFFARRLVFLIALLPSIVASIIFFGVRPAKDPPTEPGTKDDKSSPGLA
jgi:hypothetical protein